MKKFSRALCSVLTLLMILTLNITWVQAEPNRKTATILFTHDLHDHFLPFNIEQNGKMTEVGGYARLQSAIDMERQKKPSLLLVDAGDFSMGTLYQTVFASDAPELRIMGQMGYDVVTLGNHEFDFRAQGLADSLNTAKNSGEKAPQMVASNVSFPADENGKLSKSLSNLKNAMDNYRVKEYTVLKRDGMKIGVFGMMGKDAASNAPMSEVEFTDAVKNAGQIVNILKKKEKVDLVICLSHSGTWSDKSRSEDEILAKKVPGIDVIISAHTHTKLSQPIIAGKTIICSTGEYGQNLGILTISQNSDKGWELGNYTLKQIDDTLRDNPRISQYIEHYKKTVQEKYLNPLGMKYDGVLAYSPFNFVPASKIGEKHAEDSLANLITDAYLYAVKKAEGTSCDPVAVAMVPAGTIRGSFVQGNISVADAFTVSSLGIGPDKNSGYPLISVYLTGKELKTACEVDASVAPIMTAAQLYMSGITYTFNPNRLIFNKVTAVSLQKPDGSLEEIDDTKLYRVVAGLYSAQMLSVVGEKSFGLLSIVPKTKDGAPITDFEAQIIRDQASGSNNEVKEWVALAQYLQSFAKADGVSQIPAYYNKTHGRKIVDNNKNILALLSHPNSIALAVYAFILIIGTLVILTIVLIVRRKRSSQKYSA